MGETRLDFLLEGAGWASIEISAGTFSHRIDGISYLTDALDDLLRMGLGIATGKGWTYAEFDHEPALTVLVAETAWIVGNEWVSGARLTSFDGTDYAKTGINRRILREADRDFVLPIASPDELANLFLRAAQRVLETHGEDGYRKMWAGRLGFPMRALTALRAALNTPASPILNYRGD